MDDQQPLSLIPSPQDADLFDPFDPFDPLDPRAAPTVMRPARVTLPLDSSRDAGFAEASAATHLAESVVYRPGALIAAPLLAGPVICAVVATLVIGSSGAVPVWLALLPLLWLPVLALAWALLRSVRITPDTVASGRTFGQWRSVAFEEIELVEQRGLRLIILARGSLPLTITPSLLHRGAQLRRTLLLRLPLTALSGDLRTQAQILSAGDVMGDGTGDISGILTVRTRSLWPTLAAMLGVALLVLGVVTPLTLTTPLNNTPTWALTLALVALAALTGYVGLWSVQELFISDKGLVIHFALLRRERDVFWAQVRQVEYTPGELALIFRTTRRMAVSAGPGLLNATQARLMRQFIGRYCAADVTPALSRTRR